MWDFVVSLTVCGFMLMSIPVFATAGLFGAAYLLRLILVLLIYPITRSRIRRKYLDIADVGNREKIVRKEKQIILHSLRFDFVTIVMSVCLCSACVYGLYLVRLNNIEPAVQRGLKLWDAIGFFRQIFMVFFASALYRMYYDERSRLKDIHCSLLRNEIFRLEHPNFKGA